MHVFPIWDFLPTTDVTFYAKENNIKWGIFADCKVNAIFGAKYIYTTYKQVIVKAK